MKVNQQDFVKKENRVEFADIAKAIAIFLVILGHTVKAGSETKIIIYSFHMPLFFIMSGFFIRSIHDFSFGSFLTYMKKKWVALMVPYFLWGIIYAKFSVTNTAYLLYGSYMTIGISDTLSSLWFLPVMFLSFIIIYPVEMLKSKIGLGILVNMLVALLFFSISFFLPNDIKFGYPWGSNVSFFAAGFLLIGSVIRNILQKLSKSMIMFLLLLSLLIFYYTIQLNTSPIGYMRMADANYGNPIVCIANTLLGSIIIIHTSVIISWIKLPKNWITIIGANTLGIFLTHKPFIDLFKTIANTLHLSKNNMLTVLLIASLTLISSTLITMYLSNHMPILLGRTNKK